VERPLLAGNVIDPNRLIVNWGTTLPPRWLNSKARVLNTFAGVNHALSKIESYAKFRDGGVPTIESTLESSEVLKWRSEGHRVLARRDRLSGGKGIVVLDPAGGDVEGGKFDFYAKYFRKTHEYRVHVFGGRVIDLTQKKLRLGATEETRTGVEKIVRSHDHGWIHAHMGIHLPAHPGIAVHAAAVNAVSALGLDFGAVDILCKYSRKEPDRLLGLAVCEVNTAPGLENERTIEAYKSAILGEPSANQ
jgi:hypothetical protein